MSIPFVEKAIDKILARALLYLRLKSLAHRKPTLKSTQLGGSAFLWYTLLQYGPECQPPPRITRNFPELGPWGFAEGLDE